MGGGGCHGCGICREVVVGRGARVTGGVTGGFLDRLEEALARADVDELRAIIDEHATYVGDQRGVGALGDARTFAGLVRMMRDARLWTLPQSHKVVMIWQHEWGTLSESQRAELLAVLEEVAHQFVDRAARFVAMQVIGEYYQPDAALAAVERMARSPESGLRCFLPVALHFLARRTTESQQLDRIQACLRRLLLDPVEEVRVEARTVYEDVFGQLL